MHLHTHTDLCSAREVEDAWPDGEEATLRSAICVEPVAS